MTGMNQGTAIQKKMSMSKANSSQQALLKVLQEYYESLDQYIDMLHNWEDLTKGDARDLEERRKALLLGPSPIIIGQPTCHSESPDPSGGEESGVGRPGETILYLHHDQGTGRGSRVHGRAV